MKNNFFDRNYTVRLVEQKIAKSFIIKHHYSHSYPAGCVNLGAYYGEEIIGVIVFGMSCQQRMAASIVSILDQWDYYELQRLYVDDCTRTGFETWFISKSINWLKVNKPEIVMLVSFADPYYGHLGTIYQASNWLYTGTNKSGYVYIDENKKVMHARTIAKGKVDKSKLQKERRPGKHRYVMFIKKGMNVYRHFETNEIIREKDLILWLNKEIEDKKIYIVRDNNNYLKKYKYNLKNALRYDTQEYPKK